MKIIEIFPWGDTPPESTYEALDWIVTSQKLRQMGYSNDQIESLYKIRKKEVLKYKALTNDVMEDIFYELGEKDESGYDKNSPFNAVISDEVIESTEVTRGPASIESNY